jgi:hypothetical protein
MILSAQDGQETQLSDLESLLSCTYTKYKGAGHRARKHDDTVLWEHVHRAESQATHVVHPHQVRHMPIYTNWDLPLLWVIYLHRFVLAADIPVDRGREVPGPRGR